MDRDVAVAARAALLREVVLSRLVREIPVPSPGAGSEWSQLVPGGSYWQVLAARMRLSASAVVATRVISLTVLDGDNNRILRINANTALTAGNTHEATFALDAGYSLSGSPSLEYFPPPPYVLSPGWSLKTLTGSLDVGDAYDQVFLTVLVLSAWDVEYELVRVGEELDRTQGDPNRGGENVR